MPDMSHGEENLGDDGSAATSEASIQWVATTYGEPTTFGSQPWHSEKNWWKAPSSGEANDVRAQFSTLDHLACAAVSLRGNKHRLEGSVNQDSFSVVSVTSKDNERFLVIAVCDGMGSARFSSYAARTASSACTALLSQGLRMAGRDMFEILGETSPTLVREIRKRVTEFRAGEFDAPTSKMSADLIGQLQTTLSFAVIGPSDFEEMQVLTGWIGDSPVYCIREGNWVSGTRPPDGEGLHSSAADGLMTTEDLLMRYDTLSRGDSLLICTDGVGNFLEHNGAMTSLGQDLRHRWEQPPERLEFIRDLSFEIQSADDDRTAVMVWYR